MADAVLHLQGPALADADSVLVLLHGRGATASGMAPLAGAVAGPKTCVLAPQAPRGTWYPDRFLVERDRNEPWLSQALQRVDEIVASALDAGVSPERIVISGFSQGACLAVEYVARRPERVAGCVAFAGALIGPDPFGGGYDADLTGVRLHLAVGDQDQHVPPSFAEASAEVLRDLGAEATVTVHPGMGHTIHPDDVDVLATLLRFEPTLSSDDA